MKFKEIECIGNLHLESIILIVRDEKKTCDICEFINEFSYWNMEGISLFKIMFMIIDRVYSLVSEYLNIEKKEFVLRITPNLDEADVTGTEAVINGKSKMVNFISIKPTKIKERDERGVIKIMLRTIKLMIYSVLITKMNDEEVKKQIKEINQVIHSLLTDTMEDASKWLSSL